MGKLGAESAYVCWFRLAWEVLESSGTRVMYFTPNMTQLKLIIRNVLLLFFFLVYSFCQDVAYADEGFTR